MIMKQVVEKDNNNNENNNEEENPQKDLKDKQDRGWG